MLVRFNRWFDRVPEPWRFMVFVILVLLPITALQAHLPITALGAVFALIAMRVWWLYFRSKRPGPGPDHSAPDPFYSGCGNRVSEGDR